MQVDDRLEGTAIAMTQVAIEQLPVALGRERPIAIQPVDLLEQDSSVQIGHVPPSHSWFPTQLSARKARTNPGKWKKRVYCQLVAPPEKHP